MKKILRCASLVAIGAAAAGLALPTSAAHAVEPLPCPHDHAVCVWSNPHGQGRLRLLHHDDHLILPAVRSAHNRTSSPWCLYERPRLHGDRHREIYPHQSIHDIGFPALSARRGHCNY